MTKPGSHTCMLPTYVRHSHRYYLPWVTFRKYGACHWQHRPSQLSKAGMLAKFWGQLPKRASSNEWFGINFCIFIIIEIVIFIVIIFIIIIIIVVVVVVIIIIIIIITSIMCTYPGPKSGIPASAMSGQYETKTQFPGSFLSKCA